METPYLDYKAVNHHPHAVLDGDRSLKCIFKKVKAGSSIVLDATGSTDPDGNNLIYKWSVYSEPGSYQDDVKIEGNNAEKCKVHIPSNTAGKNIHIILELTDKATPALTVYRRVVLRAS